MLFALHDNYIDYLSRRRRVFLRPRDRVPALRRSRSGRGSTRGAGRSRIATAPTRSTAYLQPNLKSIRRAACADGLFHRRLVEHPARTTTGRPTGGSPARVHSRHLGRAVRLDPRLLGRRRAADLRERPRPADRLARRRPDQPPPRRQAAAGRPELDACGTSPCDDAERIPWFDAAHHDRFILHGAGYSGPLRRRARRPACTASTATTTWPPRC